MHVFNFIFFGANINKADGVLKEFTMQGREIRQINHNEPETGQTLKEKIEEKKVQMNFLVHYVS